MENLNNFYDNVFEVVFCSVIAVVQKKGARGLGAVLYMTDVKSREADYYVGFYPKAIYQM